MITLFSSGLLLIMISVSPNNFAEKRNALLSCGLTCIRNYYVHRTSKIFSIMSLLNFPPEVTLQLLQKISAPRW